VHEIPLELWGYLCEVCTYRALHQLDTSVDAGFRWIGDLKAGPTLDVIEEFEASLITSGPPHLNSVCFDV
jgi:hypothetical protein